MFIQLPRDRGLTKAFVPDFTVLHCPNFHADPDDDLTRSGTFVALHLTRKLVLIGGTAYAGEIKKSIFSVSQFSAASSGCAFHALLCQREQG